MSEALSMLYIVPHDPFGHSSLFGASVSTGELAVEMVRRGHSVSVVHSYVNRPREYTHMGVEVHGIPNGQYPYIAGLIANLGVSKFIDGLRTRADIDILDSRGGGLGWAFWRSATAADARVLHLVDVSLKEWVNLPLETRLKMAPTYFMLAYNDRLCLQAADWIVAETAAVGRDLTQTRAGAHPRWSVVPPLIPRSWGPIGAGRYDPLEFLFIGAGSRRDTLIFLQALQELTRRGFDVKANILREGRYQFRELATKMGLHVRFWTYLETEQMRELLARSCAFVLPSYREAYCRTVVEAAFHGTPSIVSNLSSVREFVDPGRTGLVVPTWNPLDWAQALQLLIADPGLHDRLGEAARAKAIQNCSADRVGSLTEIGYRDVLTRR
jgi:glycosyltransferase involved in cell wall biosynthesis